MRLRRLIAPLIAAGLIGLGLVAASVSPGQAAALAQQLTITPVGTSVGPGTILRFFRVTDETGQPVSGVTLFGSNGGPQGGGFSPFCVTPASNADGALTFFDNPSYRCNFTSAYTGNSSPLTGQPPAPGDARWPISLPVAPPYPIPLGPATRTGPGSVTFNVESGDAVITSRTNVVSYASPTGTPYVLSARFAVGTSPVNILLNAASEAGFEVVRQFRDSSGAIVGAECVGAECGNGSLTPPPGTATLHFAIKATAPVTIGFGYVDLFPGLKPVVSGPPVVGEQPTTTSSSSSTTTIATANGLQVTAPASVVVGQPFAVSVSGASAGVGRIDLSIGSGSVGSQTVSPSGTNTFQATAWAVGETTVTARWVRYVNGTPVVSTGSVPITITGSGATTAPPTTAPPTTAGPTTAPPTTAGSTTAPPTTAGPTTTVPSASALVVTAPDSAQVGKPFTITISGAKGSTGRFDVKVGASSVGSFAVDASGSLTASVTAWATGATSVTVDWVRYEVGTPITVTGTAGIKITS